MEPDFNSGIIKLKELITKIDDIHIGMRSKAAAKQLSEMTEEERKLLLMYPEEKKFFLKYKKLNPENPWGYFKEYQKMLQEAYKKSGQLSVSETYFDTQSEQRKKTKRTSKNVA
ncbi:MAG: hypothetical protein ABI723_01800 [Bacteroidia bacterium]